MHTIRKVCLTVLGVVAVATVTATKVSAQTVQHQRQSASSETSFSSSCEGSGCGGKIEFKSTTDIQQSQHQSSGMGGQRGTHSQWRGWDENWNDWEDAVENTAGEVKLTWALRDGTCSIQYRMVGQAGWPYSTQADCNQGNKTIGGLQQGKNYQFRIKKNDGRWSRPMTRHAE